MLHLITQSIKEYSLKWLIIPPQASPELCDTERALVENEQVFGSSFSLKCVIENLSRDCNEAGERGANRGLIVSHNCSPY